MRAMERYCYCEASQVRDFAPSAVLIDAGSRLMFVGSIST